MILTKIFSSAKIDCLPCPFYILLKQKNLFLRVEMVEHFIQSGKRSIPQGSGNLGTINENLVLILSFLYFLANIVNYCLKLYILADPFFRLHYSPEIYKLIKSHKFNYLSIKNIGKTHESSEKQS